jgi:hypothetical protein
MIGAILWKEWREQRTVAAAVLSFGALALVLTAQFADPATGVGFEGAGARELMPIALAYLVGSVSGAILLADEKEVGTLEFLDTLPCRRRTVWAGKVVAGAALALGQCAVLALVAFAVGSVDQRVPPPAYGMTVGLVGLLAFAWGVFGGALARSTLGAVFQGSLAAVVAGAVLLVPFALLSRTGPLFRLAGTNVLLYYGAWVGTGLLGSAALFTTTDRRRRVQRPRPAAGGGTDYGPRKPWLAGVRALGWLTARQAVWVAIGAAALGLVVGAAMLPPEAQPLFVWPGATLGLGVLAGVTTVGEEQVRGVARYWAERRLPLGRLWLVKTLFYFGIAALGAALLFGLVWAGSPALPFRSRLLVELRAEAWRFLFLGLVYGFAVGHLAGMVFRKTVVAGLVAAVTAASMAALVLPSVVGGGAARWQVWGPAVVLLATARLLLYPWATDRVATRGPVLRAVGGGVLAVAVLAAGIAYRVVEVPAAPDRLAESGYLDSLPSYEANEGGQAAKSAATQFRRAAAEAKDRFAGPGGTPAASAAVIGSPRRPAGPSDPADGVGAAGRLGWTGENVALGPWLDEVFRGEWVKRLTEAADKPLGVFEDPRDLDYYTPLETLTDLVEMSSALRARGVQRQSAGDPDAYPRLLRGGLAVARTARHRGGLASARAAHEAEELLLAGLADWLDRLDGRADLLRVLLAELDRHEALMPVGTADAFWAEQVILRNTMERVGTWLPTQLGNRPGTTLDGQNPQAEAEGNLVSVAWTVPWERLRRERLLRAQTDGGVKPEWLSGLHRGPFARSERTEVLAVRDRRGLALRRFARLTVALRLYQLDHGHPAADLAALVPAYLPAVPDDPYGDQPFGYRLSAGERVPTGSLVLPWEANYAGVAGLALAHPIGGLDAVWAAAAHDLPPPRRGSARFIGTNVQQYLTLEPGSGVVWSVGPDGQDNGGQKTGQRGAPVGRGDDWVVVVPSLPKRD